MSTQETIDAEKILAAKEEALCHSFDSIINRPKTTLWDDFCDGMKTKWENFKSWF